MKVVEALFSFQPLFQLATKKARQTIMQRAEGLGLPWEAEMKELRAHDQWSTLLAEWSNPAVVYPAYYEKRFHAYPQGNLCWDAAMEVAMAARSVHAPVMDPENKLLDPEGDSNMRRAYHVKTRECMVDLGAIREIKDVVDLGCATGLSSLAILESFPGAQVTGVDLSPHFLAVGQYDQQKRMAQPGACPEPLTFLHASAEHTGLPDACCDLVSVCLVCHELPESASRAVFQEAHRLLRPGGCLAVMEMNPASPAFQRIFDNPFAFAAFKSTEPWLESYMAMDMHGALRDAGFVQSTQKSNTPKHRSVVALKAAH